MSKDFQIAAGNPVRPPRINAEDEVYKYYLRDLIERGGFAGITSARYPSRSAWSRLFIRFQHAFADKLKIDIKDPVIREIIERHIGNDLTYEPTWASDVEDLDG